MAKAKGKCPYADLYESQISHKPLVEIEVGQPSSFERDEEEMIGATEIDLSAYSLEQTNASTTGKKKRRSK